MVTAGTPQIVRAEGVAELVGDLILSCTGGAPTPSGEQIPLQNVQITINTNITSRIVGAGNVSEALLLIDDPFPDDDAVPSEDSPAEGQALTQLGCLANNDTNCAITSVGPGIGINGSYNGAPGQYNIFQGTQTSVNSISWTGVPIDGPGDSGTRIIRITNIRANASLFGVSSTLAPTQILEFLTMEGPTEIAINQPSGGNVVGEVALGFTSAVVPGPGAFTQCVAPSSTISVTASEGFASAFKPQNYAQVLSALSETYADEAAAGDQNVPGFQYNTESGFRPDPSIGAGTFVDPSGIVGLATQGTQIQLTVAGISAGVTLSVPTYIYLNGSYGEGMPVGVAVLVGQTAPPVVFAPATGAPGPYVPLTFSGTAAIAVYEILYADPTVVESATVPISVSYIPNADAGTPSQGSTTVTVSLAPLSSNPTASSMDPVPRFVQLESPATLFTIAGCTVSAIPTLTSINPNSGVIGSTVTVTLIGTNFVPGATVNVNNPGVAVNNVTAMNPTQITATLVIAANAATGPTNVTVTTSGGTSGPVSFTITPTLTLTPTSLTFTTEAGATTPLSQPVQVTTQVPGATIEVSPGNATPWLTVSPATATTPANFQVTVIPQGLASGTYNGTVTFSGPQVGTTPLNVVLTVTPAEALITPSRATFSYSRADPVPPPDQTFSITSNTGAQTSFEISTSVITPPGGTWLTATVSGGVTPANVTVSVNPAGLGRGSFVGVVTVTPAVVPVAESATSSPHNIVPASDSATPPPQNIIVTIGDIAPGPYMAAPEPLIFDASSLSQIVTVNNSAPTNTTATPVPDPGWLTVNQPMFATPSQNLVATANGSQLAPNKYTGVLAIDDLAGTAANGVFLDATLTVGDATGTIISLDHDSVTMTLTSDTSPSVVTIPVMSTGSSIPVMAKVTSASSWLSASGGVTVPPTGVTAAADALTPAPITITINPSHLAPGPYDDSVQVSSPDALNTVPVAVHLQVTPPPSANSPKITEIVNGASFAKGQPITPGSLVTLRGLNLAAVPIEASTIPLPGKLGSTSVTFNGFAAPLLYISGVQINAQLPWNDLAYGSTSGTIDAVVTVGGKSSAPFQVIVSAYSPGIFIDFASNRAIAQNADGSLVAPPGAYSSPSHPASVGSIISILCTGLGAVDVPVNNGVAAGAAPLRKTLAMPKVLIDGILAQTDFSGLQPQFVGINQVNATIPAGVPAGDVSLQLQIGGITTTSTVKVTIGN